MRREISIFEGTTARRSMALLACVALLYFAAGGSLFHPHTNGPDTACHVCQALHMPALAAARLDLASTPQVTCVAKRFVFPASCRARTSHRINLLPDSKCISVRWIF